MKHDKEWFLRCLEAADEFSVFVIINPETVTTVQVDKDVAATLIESGVEYGYLHGTNLILGASQTDLQVSASASAPEVPANKPEKKVDKAHEVKTVLVPYSDVEVSLQSYLDDGWQLATSYKAHDHLALVLQRHYVI
jgi:hypothetical protein